MGVLEPLNDLIDEEVPATPPDLQDLQPADDSEDDLFAEPDTKTDVARVFSYNDLSFKHIVPVLPSKGEFEDIMGLQNSLWESQPQPAQKKKNFCSRCFDEMKKDLKKLAKVIENYKNERDAARAENESLKKEVEELKKVLKQKEENEKAVVNVVIDNKNRESVDVSIRRKNFQNAKNFFNSNVSEESFESTKQIGIKDFSISIQPEVQSKPKKTVAELRREFFAEEFKSEQKSFTSHNYFEMKKPQERKETERSRLTINVKPKQNINEIISKLTSKLGTSKVIPETASISMFQRFEKTKDIWRNGLKDNVA